MYVNCIDILHMDFWFLTIEYVLMQPLSITMSVVKSHLNKVERPHRAFCARFRDESNQPRSTATIISYLMNDSAISLIHINLANGRKIGYLNIERHTVRL